jgi:hypothetical protein
MSMFIAFVSYVPHCISLVPLLSYAFFCCFFYVING